MSRRALLAVVALIPIAVPAFAYEIKPKTPDTAFSGKLQPDIVGLSSDVDAGKARSLYESYLKDLPGVKPKAEEQKARRDAAIERRARIRAALDRLK